jgi:peptide/nickel transport system permease protein
MFAYLIRRLCFAVPIVFGVMLVTFFLFFVVQSPTAMARRILGPKATPQVVENWLHNRGYDKPLLINFRKGEPASDSLFIHQMRRLALFDFGTSDVSGRPLKEVFATGVLPSLLITVPAFVLGFAMALGVSLYLVFLRNSWVDSAATLMCVALMSVPAMVYIIFGQYLVAQKFSYLPAFGFSLQGFSTAKFLVLPVALMVVSGLGAEVRLYRALFLEELGQDYIRTARAKGLASSRVLLVHVLKNGLINLITVVVASLPFLIMGSLVMENFFGIPGLGNVLFVAIQSSDFAVVQASVFLGSLLYLGGLVLTDVCYAWVDPRIRFQ